jgi:hypothetical protein
VSGSISLSQFVEYLYDKLAGDSTDLVIALPDQGNAFAYVDLDGPEVFIVTVELAKIVPVGVGDG